MRNQIFAFLISMIPPYMAAITGVFFKPGSWYQGIIKPSWTPPPLAFPIVWTILYFFMGITLYYLYRTSKIKSKVGYLYVGGLVLNALWSPVFFGAHQLWLGLFIIGCLWLTILVFIFFMKESKGIVTLNGVYLLWLTLAFSLNLSIAVNNGPIENVEVYLDQQFESALKEEPRAAFRKMSASTVIQKTSSGYHRLKKEDLYRWNQLRLKMAKANPELCSSLWLGGGSDTQMYKSMQSFERGDLKDWAELSARAFEAGWKVVPARLIPESEVRKVLLDISLSLKGKERERFFESLKSSDRLNPDDSCWMLKTTLSWLDKNRGEQADKLLFFFAKKLSP